MNWLGWIGVAVLAAGCTSDDAAGGGTTGMAGTTGTASTSTPTPSTSLESSSSTSTGSIDDDSSTSDAGSSGSTTSGGSSGSTAAESSSGGALQCPEDHPEWTSGSTPCITVDGCPNLSFSCTNAPGIRVAVCHAGFCVDERDEFAEDFCVDYGGAEFAGSNNGAGVCEASDDVLACLQCRYEATVECWAGACADEVDTLQTCIDADVVDLPVNAAYYGWIFSNADENDNPCWEEGWAYRDCVNANCEDIHACNPDETFQRAPLVHRACAYYQD